MFVLFERVKSFQNLALVNSLVLLGGCYESSFTCSRMYFRRSFCGGRLRAKEGS